MNNQYIQSFSQYYLFLFNNVENLELAYNDIHDFNTSSETGFGINSGIGGNRTDMGDYNLHPQGSTTISMTDKGSTAEQTTHATIGAGNITVGGDTNPELAGLNRDTDKVQEITRDEITGVLDGSVTVDNRIFTESGREQIADQHENLVDNIDQTLKDASVSLVTDAATVAGMLELTAGSVLNPENSSIIIDSENNKIMVTGGVIGSGITGKSGAITLGNVELYYDQENPFLITQPYGASEYGWMPLEYHEDEHIKQWHNDGAIKFIYNWLKSGNADIKTNPYESGASQGAKDRLIKEGIFDIIQNNGNKYYKGDRLWENKPN